MSTGQRSLSVFAAMAAVTPMAQAADPVGRITGVGGIFFESRDPKALMAWYRDVLGLAVESWGGAMLRYDAPGHPPVLVLNMVDAASGSLAPSSRAFMLNFAVDDLAAFLDRVQAKGVPILERDDDDPGGKFAWIVDPEGTRIELWQPRPEAAPR